MNDNDAPLEVSDGTLFGQIATLLRYLVTTVGGYALGRGWIDGQLLQVITGIVTVALPTAYGIWKTYTTKKSLIITANAAPDSVAIVKS